MRLRAILCAIAFCLAPTAVAAQQFGGLCALDPACKRWADFITEYTLADCRIHPWHYKNPWHYKKGVNCRDVRDQEAQRAFLACMSEGAGCTAGTICMIEDGRPPICCFPGDRVEFGRCRGPSKPKNPEVSCWLSGKVWASHMSPHCREHGICTKEATGVDDKYQCDYWQNPQLPEGQKNFACCRSDQICDSSQLGVIKDPTTGQLIPYGLPSGSWGQSQACKP